MTKEWFETKIKYEKTMEDGVMRKTSESYLVDATSFTEAEKRIIEEVTPFISGEFEVNAVKKIAISELFEGEGARWYNAKVAFISIDEKSGQEKRTTSTMFVQADDFEKAYAAFKENMKGTMFDWELLSLSETAILEIYKYGEEASE